MEKAVRNIYSVATSQAQKLGYTDFSEGSPGDKKREKIVRALKQEGTAKSVDSSLATILQELVKSLEEYARLE